MKKLGPIVAPGVNVDAGPAVDDLAHHPRDQRDAAAVQVMGDAVDGDRGDAGVGGDDLGAAAGGWVAVEGGADIEREGLT